MKSKELWRGWTFTDEADASTAYRTLLGALRNASETGNHSAWRSLDQATGLWWVVSVAVSKKSRKVLNRTSVPRGGTPAEVPEAIRTALRKRRMGVFAEEVMAGRIRENNMLSRMERHTGPDGGKYLHSDGTLREYREEA